MLIISSNITERDIEIASLYFYMYLHIHLKYLLNYLSVKYIFNCCYEGKI